jgi:hypothetical protein
MPSIIHIITFDLPLKKEGNNKINFLDITIHRLHTKLEYKIYRKPASTSTVINSTSCHPVEHKTMAFNFLYNRLSTYPLNETNKNLEAKIIKQIAYENSYFSNNTNLKKYNKFKNLLYGQYTILQILTQTAPKIENGPYSLP